MWFGFVLMDSMAPMIEILGIYELVYEAFRQQLTHRSGDSAEAKSHMDAASLP